MIKDFNKIYLIGFKLNGRLQVRRNFLATCTASATATADRLRHRQLQALKLKLSNCKNEKTEEEAVSALNFCDVFNPPTD